MAYKIIASGCVSFLSCHGKIIQGIYPGPVFMDGSPDFFHEIIHLVQFIPP